MELGYGSLDYKKIVKQLIDLLEEKHIKTNSDGKKYIMFWLISSNPYFIVNQYQIYSYISISRYIGYYLLIYNSTIISNGFIILRNFS